MDFNLNHGEEIIEDMLGNNREYTLALREAFKMDSKTRFRITAIIAGLFGFIGLMFLLMPFIPSFIGLWMMGMSVGMFLAGIFGLLFSMPLADGVSVHLKVIDYVDSVIKNTDYRRPNLMEDKPETIDTSDMIELSSEEDDCDEEEGEEAPEGERTRDN